LFRDPDVIILDEPLANIDNYHRHALFQIIKTYAKTRKKIIILISHNLHYTKFVDTIYFLEKGEIKETGNHKELLEKKGLYYKLFLKDINESEH